MDSIGMWRATYVPGRWVVLSGPTSLVILEPAPAGTSALLNDLWGAVATAPSAGELAERLAAFRVDLMPSLAAFFWSGDQMHSLVRGALSAVDVATGEVIASGEGFQTWREVGLGEVKQVRVEMDPVDPKTTLQLPLVVGAVLASSIVIDATDEARISLPVEVVSDDEGGSVEPREVVVAVTDDLPEGSETRPSAQVPGALMPSALVPGTLVRGSQVPGSQVPGAEPTAPAAMAGATGRAEAAGVAAAAGMAGAAGAAGAAALAKANAAGAAGVGALAAGTSAAGAAGASALAAGTSAAGAAAGAAGAAPRVLGANVTAGLGDGAASGPADVAASGPDNADRDGLGRDDAGRDDAGRDDAGGDGVGSDDGADRTPKQVADETAAAEDRAEGAAGADEQSAGPVVGDSSPGVAAERHAWGVSDRGAAQPIPLDMDDDEPADRATQPDTGRGTDLALADDEPGLTQDAIARELTGDHGDPGSARPDTEPASDALRGPQNQSQRWPEGGVGGPGSGVLGQSAPGFSGFAGPPAGGIVTGPGVPSPIVPGGQGGAGLPGPHAPQSPAPAGHQSSFGNQPGGSSGPGQPGSSGQQPGTPGQGTYGQNGQQGLHGQQGQGLNNLQGQGSPFRPQGQGYGPQGPHGPDGQSPYGPAQGPQNQAHGPGRGPHNSAYGPGQGPQSEAYGSGQGPQGQAYGPAQSPQNEAYGSGSQTNPYGPGQGSQGQAYGPGQGSQNNAYGSGQGYGPQSPGSAQPGHYQGQQSGAPAGYPGQPGVPGPGMGHGPSAQGLSAQSPSGQDPSAQGPNAQSPSGQSQYAQGPNAQSQYAQGPNAQSPSAQGPNAQAPWPSDDSGPGSWQADRPGLPGDPRDSGPVQGPDQGDGRFPRPQEPSGLLSPSAPADLDAASLPSATEGTVFSTGLAATHKPSAAPAGQPGLVLAATCNLGHANPPRQQTCLRCRGHVDTANPRLVTRPVLATLQTAGGATAELTDAVLVGRAPQPQAEDNNPILLPVPSPNSDISRTHVRFAAKDWVVTVTDLHSTNGTMLTQPGRPPSRMVPGSAVEVGIGAVIDLGDGATITVRPPQ